MHADFADWHRVVSIEPQTDELRKHWEAIEAFSQASTSSDLLELTRLFYGLALRNDQFLGKFRAVFKATDDAFRMKDNDAELRMLAGASLVNYFQYDTWGATAALALACADCLGLRSAPVAGIVQLAVQKLSELSAALRVNDGSANPARVDLSGELEALKTAFAANTVTGLNDPLMRVVHRISEAVDGLNSWIAVAAKQQALRAEESDVLWWLYGGYSRDPVAPFSDLECPSACLVGAKDLADLTRRIPGPFAAEAFLGSVLNLAHPSPSGQISIADGVGGCTTDYLGRFLTGMDVAALGDLCPVHQAARSYLDAGGKKSWLAVFVNAVGFKATEKIAPLDFAVQIYRERLLFRAVLYLEDHDD